MEIFRFDRREKLIQSYESKGLLATRIAAGHGQISLTCLTIEPGGVIGTHPATGSQLFLVINGEGWVAGPDGRPIDIRTGWAVRWDAGEEHTTGTQTGLAALAVEGAPLDLFEPETPLAKLTHRARAAPSPPRCAPDPSAPAPPRPTARAGTGA